MRGLWRAPHLPLFLLAALWAGLVPVVWLWPDLSCDPVAWHRQELVVGFAGAAMGGYLLTALPHWLKSAGASGVGLSPRGTVALVVAWLAGRATGGACVPDPWALFGLSLYPLALALCLVVPVARAGVWQRLPIALAPLLLVLITLRLRLYDDGLTAVLGVSLLVALVGGRIVPAFLSARSGQRARRRPLPLEGRLADAALALALLLQLVGADDPWIGALLVTTALGQTLRMRGWSLAPVLWGHADLAMLLAAWLWLPLGLAFLGAALLGLTGLSAATSLHALTMGLLASMVLAVMSRAWMRRVPGRLLVGRALATAFVLLQLALAARLWTYGTTLAVLPWIGSWAIATGAAALAVARPIPHPVLSAR